MIGIDVKALPVAEAYKILIGSVVPRPIAWVSSVDAGGVSNVAPFSFFTAVCSNPPTILFCPVSPPDRPMKDTLSNIRETREFVVNIATEDNVRLMNQTSAPYAKGDSEFEKVGLTPLPSTVVKAPRVKESPIHLECRLMQIVDVGPGGPEKNLPGSGSIVIGEIVYAHIAEEAYSGAHHIDIQKIKPVSRLAGTDYAPVREIFSLDRPKSV